MSKKTVNAHRDDGAPGLTLDELAAFVQDAMRAGAPGISTPKVRATMGGRIIAIELEIGSLTP